MQKIMIFMFITVIASFTGSFVATVLGSTYVDVVTKLTLAFGGM